VYTPTDRLARGRAGIALGKRTVRVIVICGGMRGALAS